MQRRFACFLAAIALTAGGSASATILTAEDASEVSVAHDYETLAQPVERCGTAYLYEQRVTFPGAASELVLTEFLYTPGHYDLTLLGKCEGEKVYGVGSCACSTENGAPATVQSPLAGDDDETCSAEP